MRPTKRKPWPLLEEDAGKGFLSQLFKYQVNYTVTICFSWKIFLRDLGPAHHHPSSHCGLLSRCHLLLQHGRLILFHECEYQTPYIQETNPLFNYIDINIVNVQCSRLNVVDVTVSQFKIFDVNIYPLHDFGVLFGMFILLLNE